MRPRATSMQKLCKLRLVINLDHRQEKKILFEKFFVRKGFFQKFSKDLMCHGRSDGKCNNGVSNLLVE